MNLRLTAAAAAILLSVSTGAIAKPVPTDAEAKSSQKSTAAKLPDFDIAQVMAVFDKIFPAQPNPTPARLALSRTAVQALFPDGTYARMMNGLISGTVDRVMGLSAADFGLKPAAGKAADPTTLRQKMAKDDPFFEERMRVTQKVLGEEMAKMAAIIEPSVREGLARSMARRFDEKQLADLNAFLATDSGKAFGSQSMAMWVDPDVMRAIMNSIPQVMAAAPGAMQRVEAETARLPKPKSGTKPKR